MIKISFKKQTINKKLLSTISLFSLFSFLIVSGFPVQAASTATVTATVTVQNISVSVSDGTVAYGTLSLNTSAGTNGSDTQTATNNGNVTETLLIKGQNTAAWTLAATAGSDQYRHMFCTSSCASPTTNYTALTTSNQTLGSSIATSGTATFDLYLTSPTSSSSYTQQSVDVTVTATAS